MINTTNTQEIINTIQHKIQDVVNPLVAKSQKYALIDFPNHPNVGDSAIWLGELEYFKNIHKSKPSYVCEIQSFNEQEMRHAIGEGTIFIHGGGNFGDIWPHHQEFRRRILEGFKENPIVQMPQSLHFGNKEELDKSKDYINTHPNFTLLVRDQVSYDLAKEHYTCDIFLCPDMAFFIGQQDRRGKPQYDLFCLLRTDKEKVHIDTDTLDDVLGTYSADDWLVEDAHIYKSTKRQAICQLLTSNLFSIMDRNLRREHLYRLLSKNRVERGFRQLSLGRQVITDRLHAHILSLLLDIPHVRLDNHYGKIDRFAKAWTLHSSITQKAENMEEAVKLIGQEVKSNE